MKKRASRIACACGCIGDSTTFFLPPLSVGEFSVRLRSRDDPKRGEFDKQIRSIVAVWDKMIASLPVKAKTKYIDSEQRALFCYSTVLYMAFHNGTRIRVNDDTISRLNVDMAALVTPASASRRGSAVESEKASTGMSGVLSKLIKDIEDGAKVSPDQLERMIPFLYALKSRRSPTPTVVSIE